MTANKRSRSVEDMDMLRTIGRNIKTLRERKELTVPKLVHALKQKHGDISGFNVASITQAELGNRAPSPFRLVCIAEYFNVPVTKLMGDRVKSREQKLLCSSEEGKL